MSQQPLPPQPYPPQPYPQPYAQPGTPNPQSTNGMGIAGFVTSLVGLLSCGFLSPIGLIFSLIGLTKRPRGLAIAGAVLGAVGSVFLMLAGFAIVMGVLGVSKAAQTMAEMATAVSAGQRAHQVIERHRTANGSLPADAQGTALIAAEKDLWGTPLVYHRTGDTYKIVSLGKDKTEGTADDMTFTESELRARPTTGPAAGEDQAGDDADEEPVEPPSR